jgi:hypothetical protein
MPLASRNVVPIDLFPQVINFEANTRFGGAKRGVLSPFPAVV